jgi:hypothetical protein
MAGIDTDVWNRRRKDQDIVTSTPKENTSPEKGLAVEVAALRARVAELEARAHSNRFHIDIIAVHNDGVTTQSSHIPAQMTPILTRSGPDNRPSAWSTDHAPGIINACQEQVFVSGR